MLKFALSGSTVLAGAASSSAQDGEAMFRERCSARHQLEEGRNRVGPSLFEIVGAPAGADEDVRNPPALQDPGLTWDLDALSAFLMDPRGTVPDIRMSRRGMSDQDEVDAVIADIQENSD
ncbi:MAG: cytochrome c family protein [Pseudomonadota bacterium]